MTPSFAATLLDLPRSRPVLPRWPTSFLYFPQDAARGFQVGSGASVAAGYALSPSRTLKFQSVGWRPEFSHGSHTPNGSVGEADATLPSTRSSSEGFTIRQSTRSLLRVKCMWRRWAQRAGLGTVLEWALCLATSDSQDKHVEPVGTYLCLRNCRAWHQPHRPKAVYVMTALIKSQPVRACQSTARSSQSNNLGITVCSLPTRQKFLVSPLPARNGSDQSAGVSRTMNAATL